MLQWDVVNVNIERWSMLQREVVNVNIEKWSPKYSFF